MSSMNSTFLEDQYLDQLSVSMLTSQKTAYILWIIVTFISAIASTLILLTIFIWKPLRNDTQTFAANLAVCEIGLAISVISSASYHLHNVHFGISERMPQAKCFPKVATIALFIILIACFHFVISIDRFLGAICPIVYRNRNSHYVSVITGFVWLSNLALFVLSFILETSNEIYVTICWTRASFGEIFLKIYVILILVFSVFSVCIYILCAAILKYQIHKAKELGGNVHAISKRMKNQATRALSVNAFIHFATFTFASISSAVVVNDASDLIVAPYLIILYGLSGIITFAVYYVCQQRFKEGFRYLCQKVIHPFS